MTNVKAIILVLLFIFGCKPNVNVTVSDNFTTVNSGFIKASIVTGFEHQYDSVELTVTNRANGLQYFYNNTVPIFNNISLSVGNYGFYMDTPEPDSIQSFMSFIAFRLDNAITSGDNDIVLDASSEQALILVERSTVDGAPTIQVGQGLAIMSISTDYYYAYVLDDCLITYSISGSNTILPVTIVKEKIYLFSAGRGNIGITDPFIEVIII